MALGIDVYDRYQDVNDWLAVRRHGVRFVYVKGTDGGGQAVVRADALVRGAKSVGLPVGLYHYAQPTPSPEAQADVLVREVRRLAATGLPPALDLEGPFHTTPLETSVEFANRFLRRVRAAGFDRVTIYANTSFLSRLRPDRWAIPGLLIWAADYGPNDGRRHPDLRPYPGRVDIHQYTDRGTVPGITSSAGVDLNESLSNVIQERDDMAGEAQNILGFLAIGGPATRVNNKAELVAQSVDPTSAFGRICDIQWALTNALPVMIAAAQQGVRVDPDSIRAVINDAVRAAVATALAGIDPVISDEQATRIARAVQEQLAVALAGNA